MAVYSDEDFIISSSHASQQQIVTICLDLIVTGQTCCRSQDYSLESRRIVLRSAV